MIQTVAWTFHFRWILWFFGTLLLVLIVSRRWSNLASRLTRVCEKHYFALLGCICLIYFALGSVAKVSQYRSLLLHGQDFWLFVDILEQIKSGQLFLTRFAPQSLGWLQHGAVHPMFSWCLLLPFSFIFGSIQSALLFHPLVLGLAGWMVGHLTKKNWGPFGSLLWVLAFLGSSQVSKILMYEVHPEAAYPLFIFIWFWSLGLDGTSRIRYGSLIASTLMLVGVKEDSFLVLGPWLFWLLIFQKDKSKKALVSSAVVAVSVFILQMISVKNWSSGVWGVSVWKGRPVFLRPTVGFFEGTHWGSISDINTIFQKLLNSNGGILGCIEHLLTFIVSKPFLGLLILAPWVICKVQFWWVILPLAAAYSVLDGPRLLWNYYSAPFLGSFWFCAVQVSQMNQKMNQKLSQMGRFKLNFKIDFKLLFPLYAISASFLIGGSGMDFYLPGADASAIRSEAEALIPCLGDSGVVQSHLIGIVPLDRIWTDRLPQNAEQWARTNYVLFSPGMNPFEMPEDQRKKLLSYLLGSSDWKQVNENCQALQTPDLNRKVVLFKQMQADSSN